MQAHKSNVLLLPLCPVGFSCSGCLGMIPFALTPISVNTLQPCRAGPFHPPVGSSCSLWLRQMALWRLKVHCCWAAYFIMELKFQLLSSSFTCCVSGTILGTLYVSKYHLVLLRKNSRTLTQNIILSILSRCVTYL